MLDIDVCKQSTEESKEEWSTDHFREKELPKGSTHVIRKFINSAIYVEKPLPATVSSENTSVCQKYSNEDLLDFQSANTKRCTCSVDQKTCPCHGTDFLSFIPGVLRKGTTISKISETKTKVSQTFMSSNSPAKETLIKNWMAKKEEERKKKEMKEKMLLEAKMKERETLLEQERNNFKTWLMNKKKIEMETKKKKQKELEEQQLKELEKEKRQLENQLNFQLWLKKKEEAQLGNNMF
ncbi:hypothetical protein BDFB_001169 [Asbolus verrucosus]|uniref:Coiled-coil domain-containing protein 34 n=1 Tax=Asbolus verrucosus TaxID=1661398 RepID=A0A482VBP8_ASBVE|nr:hypothetical protein BDFB_001169 [Asbolus verrucosus]